MASYYSVSYCFAADLVITDWSSEGKCQFFSFTHSLLCNRAEQGPQPCWAVCVVLADFMRSWWKSMQENWEKVVAVLVWACFSAGTQGCRDCLSGEWGWIPHVAQCFRLDDKSFLPNHTCGVTAPLSVSWPWLYISTIPVSPVLLCPRVSHLGLPLPPPGLKSPCQPELQFRERAVRGEEEMMMPRGAKGRQSSKRGREPLQDVAKLPATSATLMKNTHIPNVHWDTLCETIAV